MDDDSKAAEDRVWQHIRALGVDCERMECTSCPVPA